jgi:hypothetical protein
MIHFDVENCINFIKDVLLVIIYVDECHSKDVFLEHLNPTIQFDVIVIVTM